MGRTLIKAAVGVYAWAGRLAAAQRRSFERGRCHTYRQLTNRPCSWATATCSNDRRQRNPTVHWKKPGRATKSGEISRKVGDQRRRLYEAAGLITI